MNTPNANNTWGGAEMSDATLMTSGMEISTVSAMRGMDSSVFVAELQRVAATTVGLVTLLMSLSLIQAL